LFTSRLAATAVWLSPASTRRTARRRISSSVSWSRLRASRLGIVITLYDAEDGSKFRIYEYVPGVEVATLPLPQGWELRVVIVENENTNGYRGLCLSPADLAASKLAAGREKDLEFVAAMLRDRLISSESLISSVGLLPASHMCSARALVRKLVGM
jgi:hypothetical protein